MVINLKNVVENERQTLNDLDYGEKHTKTWARRNSHSRTWKCVGVHFSLSTFLSVSLHILGPTHCKTRSMARKLKIMENEKHTL